MNTKLTKETELAGANFKSEKMGKVNFTDGVER